MCDGLAFLARFRAGGAALGLLFALFAPLVGCGAAEGTAADLSQLEEGARDLAQGCSWRAAPGGFEARHPEDCYRVYTQASGRVALDPVDVCAAPELPRCLLVPPGAEPFGYFDRNAVETFEILRYERDPECGACEL